MSNHHKHWSWSHNLTDYEALFALTEEDKQGTILDCAAGSACFTAQMRQQGKKVIACDPLYAQPFEILQDTVQTMGTHLLQRFRSQIDEDHWQPTITLAELEQKQHDNAAIFLQDYSQGVAEGYYQPHSLPELPFDDYQFDLALCANFLFDAKDYDSLVPYLASIKALARVAREVRIFPLVNEKGELSEHVGPAMAVLQPEGYAMEICEVAYHLQKNANALLRIWPQECFMEAP
ncbi:MAG: methyltransferase domain-containing protein [Gammaproteobacteria bacterium]